MYVGSISLTFDCRLCVSKSQQSVFKILQETLVISFSHEKKSKSQFYL